MASMSEMYNIAWGLQDREKSSRMPHPDTNAAKGISSALSGFTSGQKEAKVEQDRQLERSLKLMDIAQRTEALKFAQEQLRDSDFSQAGQTAGVNGVTTNTSKSKIVAGVFGNRKMSVTPQGMSFTFEEEKPEKTKSAEELEKIKSETNLNKAKEWEIRKGGKDGKGGKGGSTANLQTQKATLAEKWAKQYISENADTKNLSENELNYLVLGAPGKKLVESLLPAAERYIEQDEEGYKAEIDRFYKDQEMSKLKPYDSGMKYKVGEIINHPTQGKLKYIGKGKDGKKLFEKVDQ